MNWDNLRVFLELARTERLADAAARLDMDQSTVSRRIRRFEQDLNAQLFERNNQGYALSQQGLSLLEYAERVEATMHSAANVVGGRHAELSGQVRLGCTEGFGSFFVAPHLAGFCARNPHIAVDLLAVPRFVNLSRREADLAITIEPPAHDSYVFCKLADYGLKVYGTREYLEAHAPIRSRTDLRGHRFVGYVDDLVFSAELQYMKNIAPDAGSFMRSTSIIAQHLAVRRGQCLAVLPCFMARQDSRLVCVLEQELRIDRTFWLVVPGERSKTARIRAVWEYLRETASLNRGFLVGDDPTMRWVE